jgi:hypothetical protein
MAFSVTIGSLNITSWIADSGFQWERNDIDAPDSGRDAAGNMHRRIVARKDKMQITCRSITSAQLTQLFNAITNTNVSVTYTVPGGSSRTSTFYNSKKSAGVVQDIGNAILYDGVSFDLIEV